MSCTYKDHLAFGTHLYNYTNGDMPVLVNFLFDGGFSKKAGKEKSKADVFGGSLAYDWIFRG